MISRETYTGAPANGIEVSEPGCQTVLVELSGEFDVGDLETLRRNLDVVARPGQSVYVDLSRVFFLDTLCARELAVPSSSRGNLVICDSSWQARASLRACALEGPDFQSGVEDGTGEELCVVRETLDSTRR